jgi:Ca2+-binding RTX toxin-like protein
MTYLIRGWCLASIGAVGAGFAALAPGAQAATTCSFDSGTHVLTVAGTPQRGSHIRVDGVNIVVSHIDAGGSATVSCAGSQATVQNTNAIDVDMPAGGDHQLSISDPDEFQPGLTPEFGGGDEVEIVADLGDGTDTFQAIDFDTGLVNDRWVLGTIGFDWDPTDAVPDVDVILNGVDQYELRPGGGDRNVVSGQGSAPTGSAVSGPIMYVPAFSSAADVDRVIGGEGPDVIQGNVGRDVLRGAGGDDIVRGDRGNDKLLGETGIDRLMARDGKRDKRIDCGPGSNAQERARRDRGKDPAPISC